MLLHLLNYWTESELSIIYICIYIIYSIIYYYSGTIMVNRGWIPANKRKVIQNDAEKESSQNNEPVTLIGVVRHTEDRSVFAPRQQSGGTLLYRYL